MIEIDKGMDDQTYYTLYVAMFGQDNLNSWTDAELSNPNEFIDWAINECHVMDDLPDYSERDVRNMLLSVFNREYRLYKGGQ